VFETDDPNVIIPWILEKGKPVHLTNHRRNDVNQMERAI
jgi:ribosome maturation protein Sdo1